MSESGWRYFKAGACPDCKDAAASLYVAVLDGKLVDVEGKQVLRGTHIGHFPAVCKSCMKNYSLDILCSYHHIPLRIADARCKLCPK